MLSLDRNITVKLELLSILNKQDVPISSNQLSQLLEPISSATILNYCRELQDTIDELYTEDQLRLLITETGICLKNGGTSLIALTNFLLTSDLSYQIIIEVYNNKEVNSLKFCQEYGTSLSTLRRKIRALNQEIAPYGFYISSSDRTFIKGDEIKLRNFFAVFLWSIHRKFSSIPLDMELNHYIALSEIVVGKNKRLPQTQTELLSFFIYATDIRAKNKERIPFTQERYELSRHYPIKKMSSLDYWEDFDYFFTYFSFFSYVFIDINDLAFLEQLPLSAAEEHFMTVWVALFERYFLQLTDKNSRLLKQILKRNILAEKFLHIEDNLIPFFVYDDLNGFKEQYKSFKSTFDLFFSELIDRYPQGNTDFYYEFCFYNCLFFVPLEKMLTEIKIFCFTDYSYILDNIFKKALLTNFNDKYRLIFVDDLNEADIIIENLGFSEDHLPLEPSKEYLIIEAPFSSQSIAVLGEKLAAVEEKKMLCNQRVQCT
ncbi:helix-turn-helix domain-containing protein [Enterococcus pallens]|uniref:Mga helix-turn-helix domain-containing protein n=1 Tax=Enterococcus pallens ATCC BAA-351 TaxID=1158607 RepID=R2SDC3_9ENTE|nr:helix-turn-helix domain-containing protein [Enterococcus pallens]EOH90871.1 hypothetical protein UAU_03410 [Enterococcus pallens ATCC BAA-351]EOU16067.1 hypothetical protein I588_03723 [Enterococcus pallens ATCC BAA-351]